MEESNPLRFHAFIRWGPETYRSESPMDVAVYDFETERERDAFLEGVDAAAGYLDYESYETIEEAQAAGRQEAEEMREARGERGGDEQPMTLVIT